MLKPNEININKAIALCVENKIYVKSFKIGKKYCIKVDDNGGIVEYKKLVYDSQLHSAISKTWRHYAAIILNKKNAIKKNK